MEMRQSIESRESSAEALLQLAPAFSAPALSLHRDHYARLVLRLVQDDDPSVREFAAEVIAAHWTVGVKLTDRKAVEIVLADVGCASLALQEAELRTSTCLICECALMRLCRYGSGSALKSIVASLCCREAKYLPGRSA